MSINYLKHDVEPTINIDPHVNACAAKYFKFSSWTARVVVCLKIVKTTRKGNAQTVVFRDHASDEKKQSARKHWLFEIAQATRKKKCANTWVFSSTEHKYEKWLSIMA